jgi:hypothetical protein
MTAHQCPRCALLFTYRTELELHLREDHQPGDRVPQPRRPSQERQPQRSSSP